VEVVEIQSESLVRGVFHSRHTKNPIIFPFYGLDLLYANWNGWTIVHETPLPLTRLQAFHSLSGTISFILSPGRLKSYSRETGEYKREDGRQMVREMRKMRKRQILSSPGRPW
jgi:hypothetical protein